MIADIAYSTEFRSIEQVEFADGRKLAYLTFLNESDETIIGITGYLTILDESKRVTGKRRVSFKNLNVKPREVYVLNLPLDDYPVFSDAHMSVESISFLMSDPWRPEADRAAPEEAPTVAVAVGHEKAALARIAEDALCFPEQHDAYWTCVCGRNNPKEWNLCFGCHRMKYRVFREFNKETVMAGYQAHRTREKETVPGVRRPPSHAREAILAKEARIERFERTLLFVTLFILIGSLLLWGFSQSIKNPNWPNEGLTSAMDQLQRGVPVIDYLDPV